MDGSFDALDLLPELPSSIDETTAALWAATVILKAGNERRWRMDRVRKVLYTLTVRVGMEGMSDDELRAEFERCLNSART